MRARDIMSSPVHTVLPTTPVEAAAELMGKQSVTALPVVDDKGHLAGMVSESDLLWHHVASDPTAHIRRFSNLDPADRPATVGEVMSAYTVKTYPGADVAEVAEVAETDTTLTMLPRAARRCGMAARQAKKTPSRSTPRTCRQTSVVVFSTVPVAPIAALLTSTFS